VSNNLNLMQEIFCNIMIKDDFGKTDLNITRFGFGAGQIGEASIPAKQVNKILNIALDYGINLIDTARGYGLSEERIGKFLKHRRDEFILSTKVGYDISGYKNWTYDIIIAGIENALRLMKTDYLDIVHLHSCDLNILKSGEVIEALEKSKEHGKVRFIAYSGENDELDYAVKSNRFDSIQTSVNICDQRDIDTIILQAKQDGMGIIAKRPLANAPWRFKECPVGDYAEEYWKRWRSMNMDFDLPCEEIALRFTAFSTNIDTCIVGTTNENHLRNNIQIIEKGPLPEEIVTEIKDTFKKNDDHWIGQV
jgi:aryl-alcohol dehydrogenase-like predicted oxidoreductase